MELAANCVECTNYTIFPNETSVRALSGYQIVSELIPEVDRLPVYAYLIWYIIGIPANFTAFAVWMQSQMRHSSGCYMAALAITDNLFLITHCIAYFELWFPQAAPIHFPVGCQVLPMIYTAVQYLSGLLVLEFTVEQYIAISHPFKRSRYCRESIAKRVILGGVILALLLAAPQAYFFKLHDLESGPYCSVRNSMLEGDGKSIWTIWTWVTGMTMFGAVSLTCLILNILVIYEVTKKTDVQLVRNYSRTSTSSTNKLRRQNTTTAMLLAVSLYWVATEIPATIALGLTETFKLHGVYSVEDATEDLGVKRFLRYWTARNVVEVISFSRYSCKLFIYLATGRMFRKHLQLICIKTNLKRQQSDTTMTSLATKNYLERKISEQTNLINNSQLPRSVSMCDKSLPSQSSSIAAYEEESDKNTNAKTVWEVRQVTEAAGLSSEPHETDAILNNNYKFTASP